MQCVILAAGKGTRMRFLTSSRPKPMVKLLGKPLLEHIIDRLPEEIDELVIVIGYKGDQIREYFGDTWKRRSIIYVEQKEQLGTAHALFCARPYVRGRFFVITADDLIDKESFETALSYEHCLFACKHEHPERFGVVEVNERDELVHIEEKPEEPKSNFVNTLSMVLSERIFQMESQKDKRLDEYLLPDLLTQLAQEIPVRIVEVAEWFTVSAPEDVSRVEDILREHGKER